MLEQGMDEMIEREKTVERVRTIATPGDFNLGNPEGVQSPLEHASEAEKREFNEALVKSIARIEDTTCYCCIDGRHKKTNADGTPVPVRAQMVGGSASDAGVAMNAGSPIVDTIPADATMGQIITTVEDHVFRTIGKKRSAHLGGCGGAGGEVEDNEAIARNQNVMDAAAGIMADADVLEAVQIEDEETVVFTSVHSGNVSERADKTAEIERTLGWNGQKYVDGVVKDSPENVEDLETDDTPLHGHKENAVVIYAGEADKTVTLPDVFVIHMPAIKEKAQSLAMGRGRDGYCEAVVALMAKEVATAHRLVGPGMPIMVVK